MSQLYWGYIVRIILHFFDILIKSVSNVIIVLFPFPVRSGNARKFRIFQLGAVFLIALLMALLVFLVGTLFTATAFPIVQRLFPVLPILMFIFPDIARLPSFARFPELAVGYSQPFHCHPGIIGDGLTFTSSSFTGSADVTFHASGWESAHCSGTGTFPLLPHSPIHLKRAQPRRTVHRFDVLVNDGLDKFRFTDILRQCVKVVRLSSPCVPLRWAVRPPNGVFTARSLRWWFRLLLRGWSNVRPCPFLRGTVAFALSPHSAVCFPVRQRTFSRVLAEAISAATSFSCCSSVSGRCRPALDSIHTLPCFIGTFPVYIIYCGVVLYLTHLFRHILVFKRLCRRPWSVARQFGVQELRRPAMPCLVFLSFLSETGRRWNKTRRTGEIRMAGSIYFGWRKLIFSNIFIYIF